MLKKLCVAMVPSLLACSSGAPGLSNDPPSGQSVPAGATVQSSGPSASRAALKAKPLPGDGCFKAASPDSEWEQVPCGPAPTHTPEEIAAHRKRAHSAASASRAPETLSPSLIGGCNGTQCGSGDYWAAPYGETPTLFEAAGSFPNVSGITSETDGTTDNFELQLNTNAFDYVSGGAASLCSGATAPTNCQGWEQFLYGSQGQIYIEYWLLNYGNTCPSTSENPPRKWNTQGSDCWIDSPKTSVPIEKIANLATLALAGEVNGSSDTLFYVAGSTEYATQYTTLLQVSQGWTSAEFNVFGNAGGSEATINGSEATVGVQLYLSTGIDSSIPYVQCVNQASSTAETNSMNFVPNSCCPTGGFSAATIQFTESNDTSQAAPLCPVYPGVTQEITSASNDGICLDIPAGNLNAGYVQSLSCNGGDNQQWTFNGSQIVSPLVGYDGRRKVSTCLTVGTVTQGNGYASAPVSVTICNENNSSQLWTVDANQVLVNKGTDLCLDIPDWQYGQPLQAFTCNGGTNQQWQMKGL